MRFVIQKGIKMRELYILLMVGVLVVSTSDLKNRLKSSISQPGHQELIKIRNSLLQNLNVGMIVPHKNFGAREYNKTINNLINNLYKDHVRTKKSKFSFVDKYLLQVNHRMMKLTPSPTGKYFLNRLYFEEKRFFIFYYINMYIHT